VRECLLDISSTGYNERDLDPQLSKSSYRRSVTINRGFARTVSPGDVVVMPRPSEGVCYVGRIAGKFELVNDPPWADEYLKYRQAKRLPFDDEMSHIGDVVQSWPVERWQAVPVPHIPRWISYLLFRRDTIGLIGNHPDGQPSAASVLQQLQAGTYSLAIPWTTQIAEVEIRLLNLVSPQAFEHLVCDLLQLENPEMRWWHIGGSGDGGVDGIGTDLNGNVVAAVQCKWKYGDDLVELGRETRQPLEKLWGARELAVYVATLFAPKAQGKVPTGVTIWTRTEIAQLLIKHRAECVMARSLGVG
jgi:hypothetical protein